MASRDDGLHEQVGRKPTKHKAGGRIYASCSLMDVPEHLRHGDDEDVDVTAPADGKKGVMMHQSLFSMITTAGRGGHRVEAMSRFDEEGSESDEDGEGPAGGGHMLAAVQHGVGVGVGVGRVGGNSQAAGSSGEGKTHNIASPGISSANRKNKLLLKSIPMLDKLRPSRKERKPSQDLMSTSQILPRQSEWEDPPDEDKSDSDPSGEAPVLSRMLTARAEMEALDPGPAALKSKDKPDIGASVALASVSLAERLMEIFDFDEAEKVIAEYPCFLLQTVLLQGYMYLTQKHVCFYAYLPKKETEITKSGHLSKLGGSKGINHGYKRYWFQLKGDVLSYYNNPTRPYNPSGHVDLRYAISAKLNASEKDKDQTSFTIETTAKIVSLKAESSVSAKEWVKNLQHVIFRSRNDGDSVKISIPFSNIVGVDKMPALNFADTIQIHFVDSNDTYAVDEFLFSFFSHGNEAFNVLQILVNDNNSQNENAKPPPSPAPRVSDLSSTQARRSSKGRASDSNRTSQDGVRRSFSGIGSFDERGHSVRRGRSPGDCSQLRISSKGRGYPEQSMSPLSSKSRETSESFAPETESSGAIQSLDDTISASQMLEDSTLFKATTMRRLGRSASQSPSRRASEDTARSGDASGRRVDVQLSRAQSASQSPYDSTHEGAVPIKKSSAAKAGYGIGSFVPGTSPFKAASTMSEYLKRRSKDMSSLLASETMTYYEKVSGMWAGNRKHYGASQALVPGDEVQEAGDLEKAEKEKESFRNHFGLPQSEQLRAVYYPNIYRVIPMKGKIYMSNKHFCFRSLVPGVKYKIVLPLTDIENANKENSFRPRYHAFVVTIRGFEELFFDFGTRDDRDDCVITLLQLLEETRYMGASGQLSKEGESEAQAAKAEHRMLIQARQDGHSKQDVKAPADANVYESVLDAPSIVFDDVRASILNFKPMESLRVTCLTIGTRGDVQPYIALCKGLIADGHRPRIATHEEFGPWIKSHGIDFRPIAGDPAELMRICVENGMFTVTFLKEASAKFRGWIDELLATAWAGCQDSDVLIESPSAMAGIHVAEALQIPYFRAFSMPWTRTRAYPHAFMVPENKRGGQYNWLSYVIFDNVFWQAISGQVNRWRKKELGLGSTNLNLMQPNKVPFLYSFSPSVVVPPLDFSDWIRITGYWFLDEGCTYTPPKDLADFIRRARADGKKLVYIGFGSIVVENSESLTRTVVEAVLKSGVRCILSKGWSDRLGKKDANKVEVPLPPEILQIQSAPHDWLFRQIDAAAHHGGAGTTGASLRAGIPTIVKPFFGDQFFFGSRVEDLGVGICMKRVNTTLFGRALWQASHDERMKKKAALLGEQIRKENGVQNAIQSLYRDMEYAKTLVKRKKGSGGDASEEAEETWTFVGDESDPELRRGAAAEWESLASGSGLGVREADAGGANSSGGESEDKGSAGSGSA